MRSSDTQAQKPDSSLSGGEQNRAGSEKTADAPDLEGLSFSDALRLVWPEGEDLRYQEISASPEQFLTDCVITKDESQRLTGTVSSFFRRYNIIELKSAEMPFTFRSMLKVISSALMYISDRHVEELGEYTVTVYCAARCDDALEEAERCGFEVRWNDSHDICYLQIMGFLPMQIVYVDGLTEELDGMLTPDLHMHPCVSA